MIGPKWPQTNVHAEIELRVEVHAVTQAVLLRLMQCKSVTSCCVYYCMLQLDDEFPDLGLAALKLP